MKIFLTMGKKSYIVYSEEFNINDMDKDGKKFCGTTCQNKYSNRETKEQVSNFWEKYKGWIIGGGVALVVIIVLGIVLGSRKKK